MLPKARRTVAMNERKAYKKLKWEGATPEEKEEVLQQIEELHAEEMENFEKGISRKPSSPQEAAEYVKEAESVLARAAQVIAESSCGAVLVFFAAPRELPDGKVEMEVSTCEYASIPGTVGRRSLRYTDIDYKAVYEMGSRFGKSGQKVFDANWSAELIRREAIRDDLTQRELIKSGIVDDGEALPATQKASSAMDVTAAAVLSSTPHTSVRFDDASATMPISSAKASAPASLPATANTTLPGPVAPSLPANPGTTAVVAGIAADIPPTAGPQTARDSSVPLQRKRLLKKQRNTSESGESGDEGDSEEGADDAPRKRKYTKSRFTSPTTSDESSDEGLQAPFTQRPFSPAVPPMDTVPQDETGPTGATTSPPTPVTAPHLAAVQPGAITTHGPNLTLDASALDTSSGSKRASAITGEIHPSSRTSPDQIITAPIPAPETITPSAYSSTEGVSAITREVPASDEGSSGERSSRPPPDEIITPPSPPVHITPLPVPSTLSPPPPEAQDALMPISVVPKPLVPAALTSASCASRCAQGHPDYSPSPGTFSHCVLHYLLLRLQGDAFTNLVVSCMAQLAEVDAEGMYGKRSGWYKFLAEAAQRLSQWSVNGQIAQLLLLKYLDYEAAHPVIATSAFSGWREFGLNGGGTATRPVWLRKHFGQSYQARLYSVASRGADVGSPPDGLGFSHRPHTAVVAYPAGREAQWGRGDNRIPDKCPTLNSGHLRSLCGLRNLPASHPLLGEGENYWKGPVRVQMNCLALRPLHTTYAAKEGQYQAEATAVYDEANENIIQNMHKKYERTGYI
ncbi:unnamed protein product [Peniophora sp. CBMAI 1063]|nr:unnamed protein product [Peniophora sp. CBMAI 1063]